MTSPEYYPCRMRLDGETRYVAWLTSDLDGFVCDSSGHLIVAENVASLGLAGDETFDIAGTENLSPRQRVQVKATKPDGSVVEFDAIVRIDSPVEVEYYRNGGILQTVLRNLK